MVNHPPHYTKHLSGVECIEITRHMGFNLGNAIKYIWRADLKGNSLEDLKKAIFYIEDELTKRDSSYLSHDDKDALIESFQDQVDTLEDYIGSHEAAMLQEEIDQEMSFIEDQNNPDHPDYIPF